MERRTDRGRDGRTDRGRHGRRDNGREGRSLGKEKSNIGLK